MSQSFTIAARFNGPPNSGNGGYVCGILAREIQGPAEATLRIPPPLERPLRLSREGDRVMLHDGETLVGEAAPAALDLAYQPAPSLAEARDAARRYIGLHDHRYPTCFVCGQARAARDGLELFTGAVAGRDMVACTWTPGADLADSSGLVAGEFIHAALDCPSYWSLPRAGAMPALLARLAAVIDGERPEPGEELIVAAWPIKSEGRKHVAATALYHGDGRPIARAQALWIEPKA